MSPTSFCGTIGSGNLHERQRAFAEAILDPDSPVPPGLVGPDGKCSIKRFNIYRNNVIVGLVEALRAAFPVVYRIIGEEFFSAMARIYVSRALPHSPIMLDYGSTFADFVGQFEPAAELVYLRDVARLERAWLEAYHAVEARPLDIAGLQDVEASVVPGLSLVLHPSARVIRSSYPVLTIWRMNVEDGVPQPIDIDRGGEDVLVVRPDAEVELRALPAGAAAFVEALAAQQPPVQAAAAAVRDCPRFDLAGALAGLMAAGAIVNWHLPEAAIGATIVGSR